jgi:hypothetical protein
MKKGVFVFLIIVTVFFTVYFVKSRQVFSKDFEKSKIRGIGEDQKIFIQEFEPDDLRRTIAPLKSLKNLRGFLTYIFSNSPNLFFNSDAQDKWFSSDLQKAIKRHLRIYEYGSLAMESPYFPDNSTFIGAWDYPTHYQVLDSRISGEKVEIDIQYIWGKGINHEGTTRRLTFFFVLENGDWKIEDIYHHPSEFSSAFRLSDIPWDYWFK